MRLASLSLAILVVMSGVAGELRFEGLCSLGIGNIIGTCPVGYVERSLAARKLLPQWPSVLLVLFLVVLLGRVFCAWVCPTVLLRRIFPLSNRPAPNCKPAPKGNTISSYSSYAFLGGVFLASYLFRFPVFCFFCPVGLFFGFLYAVGRYFTVDALTLELVLFPMMLVLELWVLKSWCRAICPIGALLSIVGSVNRFLIPTVRKDKCLTSKGINCKACERVCPEGIGANNLSGGPSPKSCTKCLECYERCPVKAIKLSLFR